MMTKDVLVKISGLQFDVADPEPIELIAKGNYYIKNHHHYITYEEIMEEDSKITKNILKIKSNQVELMKKGGSNTHMLFEEQKKTMTFYNTPFGELAIGLFTNQIKVDEKDKEIALIIDYALEVNYSHVSDCKLEMTITSCNG